MPLDPIVDYSDIRFDERGRPYWMTQSGRRSYLAPLVAMQSNNPQAVEWARSMGVYTTPEGEIVNRSAPGSSYLRERGHWDPAKGAWDQDINWNNILATAVGGMIAGPAVYGAMQGAGAGGAAGGSGAGSGAAVLPSSSLPASALMGGPGAVGTGASVLPSASLPVAAAAAPGAASTVGGGVQGAMSGAGVAGGGSSILQDILNGVGDWGPTVASGIGAARSLSQGTPRAQQDLERILKLAEGRINQTDPLFQALNAMAYRGLPQYAKEGL